MARRKIHWHRGKVKTIGEPGDRRWRGWIIVEEKDLEDETTLTTAISPTMNWFIRDPKEGGHGGPMVDTHSNKVVGTWDKWGVGVEPETKQLGIWIEGYVHRGPEEADGEFPAGDLFWNELKSGRVRGLSWGANKRQGYFEYDDDTGEVFGNTITSLIPYEISGVRAEVRGPNGMPAQQAVPHAVPIAVADAVKTAKETKPNPSLPGGSYSACVAHMEQQGYNSESAKKICGKLQEQTGEKLYDNEKAEDQDPIPPEDWISNCCGRVKWMGDAAPQFCELLYKEGSEGIKEAFGAPQQAVEVRDEIVKSLSRGSQIPQDANEAVRESPLAKRYHELRTEETGSEDKALSDLQRVLDGTEEDDMKPEEMKQIKEAITAVSEEVKAMKEDLAPKEVKGTESPKSDTEISDEIKSTLDKISERFDTVEQEIKELKKSKQDEEDDEEETPEKPDDKGKKGKKKKKGDDNGDDDDGPDPKDEKKQEGEPEPEVNLDELSEEQKATYEKLKKDLEENQKKEIKSFLHKVKRTPTPNPSGSRSLDTDGDTGSERKLAPWKLARMSPQQRRAAGY